jgi:hypothetical protein
MAGRRAADRGGMRGGSNAGIGTAWERVESGVEAGWTAAGVATGFGLAVFLLPLVWLFCLWFDGVRVDEGEGEGDLKMRKSAEKLESTRVVYGTDLWMGWDGAALACPGHPPQQKEGPRTALRVEGGFAPPCSASQASANARGGRAGQFASGGRGV